MSKDLDIARRAVEHFHRQIGEGECPVAYDATDQAYRESMTREAHSRLFAEIRRKMGVIKNSTNTGYFINASTKGTLVRLQYNTQCTNGELSEGFVWRIAGGRAILIRYEASSPILQHNQ